MTRDRWTIFAAVAVMLAALTGAAMLMPGINRQRASLQLTASDEVMRSLPPRIALTQAALGSFRGLAVDVLWGRAEQMKRDGKFYEAMQLAEWITQLQPRFPQVWAFQAWNMAYNISVATYTPQERWMWVKSGVDLLRDEGIVLNPNAVLLYKELGWIFLHKIGQFSDDAHWYYKQQLALEWQEILGAPPEGDAEAVIAWLEPVAVAYERYVNRNSQSRALAAALEELLRVEQLAGRVRPLMSLTLRQLETRLPEVREDVARQLPELAALLDPVQKMVTAELAQARLDPLERFTAANPDAVPVLAQLAELGLRADGKLLTELAVADAPRTSADFELLGLREVDEKRANRLRAFLDDPSILAVRAKLISFVRARVLAERYHMDPLWMLELMRGAWFVKEIDRDKLTAEKRLPAIPLDFRHPGAHGLYWASLGVRRSRGILRPGDYDVLNTDRQVIHALQALTTNGKLIFDPVSGYYRQLPDPRYIDAYHHSVYGSLERIADPKSSSFSELLSNSSAPETFEAGHENFLIMAVQAFYFYGDQARAQQYYDLLRSRYSQRLPDRLERYRKPLDEFVLSEFIKEDGIASLDDARTAVLGLITQYITDGLVNGRMDTAARFLNIARRAHETYQRQQDYRNKVTTDSRMGLPPFMDMVADAFTAYLRTGPGAMTNPMMKARAWHNAPQELRQRVFDQVKEPLYAEARQFRLIPELAFDEPPDMAAYRKSQPQRSGTQTGPGTLPSSTRPAASPLESQSIRK
jgi:hypothetical protein